MKTYRGVEIYLHAFWLKVSGLHASAGLISKDNDDGTHRRGG
jgi:hypothetical protein